MPIPPRVPLVAATELGRRLGFGMSVPLEVRRVLEDAVSDATDRVEGYLGCPVTVHTATESGRQWLNYLEDGFDLSRDAIDGTVVAVAETGTDGLETGLYSVTYKYGWDAHNDPELRPVVTWIRKAAMNDPAVARVWQEAQGEAGRRLTSVSREGQSASWEYLNPSGSSSASTASLPGLEPVPPLSSLDRWRVAGRRVFSRRAPVASRWPFGGVTF